LITPPALRVNLVEKDYRVKPGNDGGKYKPVGSKENVVITGLDPVIWIKQNPVIRVNP